MKGRDVKDTDEHDDKWLLVDQKNVVLFASSDLVDVIEEGNKYPIDKVTIEKKLVQGTCFF